MEPKNQALNLIFRCRNKCVNQFILNPHRRALHHNHKGEKQESQSDKGKRERQKKKLDRLQYAVRIMTPNPLLVSCGKSLAHQIQQQQYWLVATARGQKFNFSATLNPLFRTSFSYCRQLAVAEQDDRRESRQPTDLTETAPLLLRESFLCSAVGVRDAQVGQIIYETAQLKSFSNMSFQNQQGS